MKAEDDGRKGAGWRVYGALLGTYLRPQRGRVALLALLLVGGIGLQLANPQLVRYFIDAAQTGAGLRQLLGAAGIFMTVAILRQIVNIIATYVGENVAWTATNALRADLALHCLKLDMRFHKVHKPGELIQRVDGDVNKLANFFSRLVIRLLSNLLLLVGVLTLLWALNWALGLAITLISGAAAVYLRYLNRRIVPRWEGLRQSEADLFGALEEWLNGTEDIRGNGAVDYVMGQLHHLSRNRWLRMRHAMRLNIFVITLPITVFTMAYVSAHIVGATLFRNGALTIGSLYVIFYYIDVIKGPLWEILRQVEDLQQAAASMNRIADLLRQQPTIRDGPGAALAAGALGVTFERVNFHYADDPEQAVLADVSFDLAPGQVLGLLGRTGSGKSTLTKLLFRFYDPVSGAIRLNGVDARQATQAELRGRIGMVTQDVELFHASVRENLTLFDETIPDARIAAVVRDVGLGDWLAEMPSGLDTQLAGGSSVSAGQAQLLAFARVFLRDPGLVVLDEASSRLDPATEQLIERAIDNLLRERTAIIVAHRLGTVQRADEIMILEDGVVVEHGKRAALAGDRASRFYRLLQTGLEEGTAGSAVAG
ncbi:MAG: ABC transporter ATP-binding protein [Anaerolineales bacterium]|nr:ABC transporter ATP-binding protein [Anaerolineales bacterium]MCB8951529.1 ABC transporter ATP-binding protein [Ardenticatenales bacterium]